jgi:hypothetical protein
MKKNIGGILKNTSRRGKGGRMGEENRGVNVTKGYYMHEQKDNGTHYLYN